MQKFSMVRAQFKTPNRSDNDLSISKILQTHPNVPSSGQPSKPRQTTTIGRPMSGEINGNLRNYTVESQCSVEASNISLVTTAVADQSEDALTVEFSETDVINVNYMMDNYIEDTDGSSHFCQTAMTVSQASHPVTSQIRQLTMTSSQGEAIESVISPVIESGTSLPPMTISQTSEPVTSQAGQLGTSQAGQLDTSQAGQLGTSHAGQCGTSQAEQFGQSQAGQLGTSQAGQPCTSQAGQPGTSQAGQPGTSQAGQPGTSQAGQPGTSQASQFYAVRPATQVNEPETSQASLPAMTFTSQTSQGHPVQPATQVFARKSYPVLQVETVATVASRVLRHTCEECGKAFPKATRLKEHMITHNPRPCKYCDKAYRSYAALRYIILSLIYQNYSTFFISRTHVLSVHDNAKFNCEQCGKIFKSQDNLKNHVNNNICYKELNLKPVKCNQCEHRFKNKKCLGVHVRTKHQAEQADSSEEN